ncbi:hypothetical protein FACS1894142_4680 [Spirochaetia bacterium]|nr:hypothetical protein FACS1894142_4680 [Spirochaetia bacterium]
MYGETGDQGRSAVVTGLFGQFLVILKVPQVPGAGGAGHTSPSPFVRKAPALIFGLGELLTEIRRVGVGIGGHASS